MLPLTRYRDAGDPVVLRPGGAVTAAAFVAQARALAAALPDCAHVVNLCETRHGFMLGFAAALMRGQTSLLPPGRGRGDWELLLRHFPDAYLLGEEALRVERAFDLSPFLANGAADSMQMPGIDAEQGAAILFTSGSTGQPAAHRKTWGQLCRGAAHLAEALNWKAHASRAVLGSVSPQHMFGLEATVMLPWHAGVPVHAGRPLLAADVQSVLRQCNRPSWWMTTPMHLRAPLKIPATLEGLEGVLASTMSLPPALAGAAESAWQVPVMEIYGSTETGALAIRRTARESAWVPLTGVTLWREDGGRTTWAAGSHVGSRVQLADEIELRPDGRFVWLGRSTDLIKVGGRRASLSALDRSLTEVPGVEDGAYCVPGETGADAAAAHDGSRPAQRLAAVYVSSTLSPQDVLHALRERIDPAFLPRPLFRVAELPRNGMGKLPQSALAGLLARCRLNSRADSRAEGGAFRSMVVPAGHPALAGHFPDRPIVPGVVILARVWQAMRVQLPHVELGALLNARFHSPLAPGQAFLVCPRLDGEHARFEVRLADSSTAAPGSLIVSGRWACRATRPAGAAGA